jgi:chromosome partitioning protein
MANGDPSHGQIIVLGNEKGGTGKSTTAMHLAVALMRDGHSVATIDIDSHQGTLSRYVENRRQFADGKGVRLPIPEHTRFDISATGGETVEQKLDRLDALAEQLTARVDYVVMDCPGSDNPFARHAISLADVLISPVNDSFIDLDLLARIGGTPPRVLGPSVYSQTVWEQKQERARKTGAKIDWIVLRNRLSTLESRNKANVGITLDQLASRIGFRLVEGFHERVIFRQLFLQGLTVLDLRDEGTEISLNLSHVAARQEIRRLLEAVKGEGSAEEIAEATSIPTETPSKADMAAGPA